MNKNCINKNCMNAKQILYHALESCGMTRFYRRLTLDRQTSDALENGEWVCHIVRTLLYDKIPEMRQVLK